MDGVVGASNQEFCSSWPRASTSLRTQQIVDFNEAIQKDPSSFHHVIFGKSCFPTDRKISLAFLTNAK